MFLSRSGLEINEIWARQVDSLQETAEPESYESLRADGVPPGLAWSMVSRQNQIRQAREREAARRAAMSPEEREKERNERARASELAARAAAGERRAREQKQSVGERWLTNSLLVASGFLAESLDYRLRTLERLAGTTDDPTVQEAYLRARLRAGHDLVELGGRAHQLGLHEKIRPELDEGSRYHFDLGKHALEAARASEHAIHTWGPSVPVALPGQRGRPNDAETRAATDRFHAAHDALRAHTTDQYRREHPSVSKMGIFDREHADVIKGRRLDAMRQAGATPHQLLAGAHAQSGGGSPRREGDVYYFPTSGPEHFDTERKIAAIRRVLPRAEVTHQEGPHPMWGWTQPLMRVDIGPHTGEDTGAAR